MVVIFMPSCTRSACVFGRGRGFFEATAEGSLLARFDDFFFAGGVSPGGSVGSSCSTEYAVGHLSTCSLQSL